jgi:hypothetical protein
MDDMTYDNGQGSNHYSSNDMGGGIQTNGLPPQEPNAGNIDKIRDILFGSNMRDYDQRFARLEETLRTESAELREATRRRLEALEAYVQSEFSALEGRLNSERDQRSDSQARLANDLSNTASQIARRISDFETQEAQSKREIRSDILRQSKDLNDAIVHKATELAGLMDRRFQELHHSKTDRAGLAEMFSEVALRLKDQFKVPGTE